MNKIEDRARGHAPWVHWSKTPLVTIEELTSSNAALHKWQKKIYKARRLPQPPCAEYVTLLPLTPAISEESPKLVQKPAHKPSMHAETDGMSRCPVAKEFQKARDHHSILASTGCTRQFCQAGRAVHTDEPRIGENRALNVVKEEAEAFLREYYRDNHSASENALQDRLQQVLEEIEAGACEGIVRETKQPGRIGGSWNQNFDELEFGIRRAWRNSRKCIMRSHCEELRLCDLRSATSSADIASAFIENAIEAFNAGNIQPTVFVFPPRKVNSRGPLIWNHQLLEFAGYESEDGSVLGDPMSVTLTKAIIELGWEPPSPRSRWDLLPLVVMADGDVPVIAELPPDLGKLVSIRHPQYEREFEKLDLKWAAFPALTRLGFDIGGVQYTAAPFIGWFMDAEIGVRDLADSFRYNALPDVVNALGLLAGKSEEGIDSLSDLPEYEQQAMLIRAQTELTYAVYWSFLQAKVSMSDTLTASMKWCRFDDEFKAKTGFRLPADPYWLAPPQGSIIPLWHRGGAPNYQPKPMISKHVEDPLKAWEREKQKWTVAAKPLPVIVNLNSKRLRPGSRTESYSTPVPTEENSDAQKPVPTSTQGYLTMDLHASPEQLRCPELSVSIYFCSAGTFAEKIAKKLHDRLEESKKCLEINLCSTVKPLDALEPSDLSSGKTLLFVISSTGQGDIPTNGSKFIKLCDTMVSGRDMIGRSRFNYAVYGNGDSRYAATYNGAARKVEASLQQAGGLPLACGFFQGDTAVQATAFKALSPWWQMLQPSIRDLKGVTPKLRQANSEIVPSQRCANINIHPAAEAKRRFQLCASLLDQHFIDSKASIINPLMQQGHKGSYLITLDIGDRTYEDMGCVQVLPVNSPATVRKALRALGVNGSARLPLGQPGVLNPTYSKFLREFVDLVAPFQNFDRLKDMIPGSTTTSQDEKLSHLSSLEILERLHTEKVLSNESVVTNSVCLALPVLHARTYSTASSLSYARQCAKPGGKSSNHLDILVKPLPNGRFSQTILSSPLPLSLRYRLLPSSAASILDLAPSTPLIIVATGAGFAPVRCLLQRRIAASKSSPADMERMISLFLGFKAADVSLHSEILNEAAGTGILESLAIVSSNEEKVRVYDKLLDDSAQDRVREILVAKEGWVFVCTNLDAAKATRGVFEILLGQGGVDRLEKRWVEEVY